MLDGEETVEIACGKFRREGAIHGNSVRKASPGGGETACWTDRKPLEIACEKASLEGSDSLGRASVGGSETACWPERKTVQIAFGKLRWEKRYSMLDREETVEIVCGKLCWEGARQHAGRMGYRGNSLRKASPGGSETAWDGATQHVGRRGNHGNRLRRASVGGSEAACWTERKPWK